MEMCQSDPTKACQRHSHLISMKATTVNKNCAIIHFIELGQNLEKQISKENENENEKNANSKRLQHLMLSWCWLNMHAELRLANC